MASFGPYTPPGSSSISAGITESAVGVCPGGAASWELDANACITVNHVVAQQAATLTTWGAAITGGYVITRVKVRVKGNSPGGNLKAQLYHSGGLVGDEKTYALGGVYDKTFDHEVNALGSGWNVAGITEAIVEGAGFGVRLTWTVGGLDNMFGASIEIEADPAPSAEAKLNTALLAHGALTALVGTRIDRERWLPGTPANPTVFPRVIFQRVGTPEKIQPITGVVLGRSVHFQITSYSESSVEATTVAEAVEDALVVEGIGRFEDVTFRDEKAFWNPEARIYTQITECLCLEST